MFACAGVELEADKYFKPDKTQILDFFKESCAVNDNL